MGLTAKERKEMQKANLFSKTSWAYVAPDGMLKKRWPVIAVAQVRGVKFRKGFTGYVRLCSQFATPEDYVIAVEAWGDVAKELGLEGFAYLQLLPRERKRIFQRLR